MINNDEDNKINYLFKNVKGNKKINKTGQKNFERFENKRQS